MSTSKPTAHIENWSKWEGAHSYRLIGNVSAHPNQDTFKAPLQCTSEVLELDMAAGTCETANTHYTLGKKVSDETRATEEVTSKEEGA